MIDPIQGFFRIDSYLKYLPVTNGQVIGMYHHSFDVRVMDFLINFTTREETLHPLGVLINCDFQRFIENGQTVKIAFPDFTFPNITINSERQNFPTGGRVDIIGPTFRENIGKLWTSLKNFGRHSEVNEAYIQKTDNPFLKPMLYLCFNLKKNRSILLDDFLHLFGGGAGLTPAWDDFCVGLMLADRVFKNNAIKVSVNFFQNVRAKTTLISFWQLRFAEVGKLSLSYERFLGRIPSNRLTSTEIVKCINFGHSSGTDIMCGFHAYFSNIFGVT